MTDSRDSAITHHQIQNHLAKPLEEDPSEEYKHLCHLHQFQDLL